MRYLLTLLFCASAFGADVGELSGGTSVIGRWGIAGTYNHARVLDLSNNKNTAVATSNRTTTSSNRIAIEFNGLTASAQASPLPNATNNFSLTLWIKPTTAAVGATQIAVLNGNTATGGYYLRWRDGLFYFTLTNVNFQNGVTGVVGIWQHLCMVRRNGSNYIYLNGRPTLVGNFSPAPVSGVFLIGAGWEGNVKANWFDGLIEGVQFVNFAFSDSDVAALYKKELR
jgi:hypothetical protein